MASIKMPSGLTIEDLVVGTGSEAAAGQQVSVHYTGWLMNGNKFDSSKDRGRAFVVSLGRGDERIQARQRFGAVHLEAAVRLRLDHDHAGARDAVVAAAKQALLHVRRQRRAADVEAQVNGVRHLVDILPAGALRAHGGELDLVLRNGDLSGAHAPSIVQRGAIGSPRLFSGIGCPAALPPAAALAGISLVRRSPSMRCAPSAARSLGLGVRASRAWPCGRSSPVAPRRSEGDGTGCLFGGMVTCAAAGRATASAAISNVRFIGISK